MSNEADIGELIRRGGVYQNVEGKTAEEVYRTICKIMPLPPTVSNDMVYTALCAREKVLSTAVGNGIALPHARAPIMRSPEDQRIAVVYLKNPIDMNAPDERKVTVMFILLTFNSQTHLSIIANLVTLFRNEQFRKLLDSHADEQKLIDAIHTI